MLYHSITGTGWRGYCSWWVCSWGTVPQRGTRAVPHSPTSVSPLFTMSMQRCDGPDADTVAVPVEAHLDYHVARFVAAPGDPLIITLTAPETITSHALSPLARGLRATAAGSVLRFNGTMPPAGGRPFYVIAHVNALGKLLILGDAPIPLPRMPLLRVTDAPPRNAAGARDATAAIQRAIDDAAARGGARPAGYFPAGRALLLRNHSHVHVQAGGVCAPRRPDSRPQLATPRAAAPLPPVLVPATRATSYWREQRH